MAKSAVLGANLVDDLVPIVDSLRSSLYQSMGNRQHAISIVRRSWDGGARGLGTPTRTLDEVLDPPPLFSTPDSMSVGNRYELLATGRDTQGIATLTEVSLQYSQDDLTGGVLAPNEEFYYRVADLRGQGVRVRYYVVSAPPVTDRQKDIGWIVQLTEATIKHDIGIGTLTATLDALSATATGTVV